MPSNANKAILAALLAGLSTLLVSVQDRTSLDTMRVIDWVAVILAAVVTGLGTYVVRNGSSHGRP